MRRSPGLDFELDFPIFPLPKFQDDLASQNSYRGQTESAAIRIVTPIFKLGEKPVNAHNLTTKGNNDINIPQGTDMKIGATAEDLNAKFAETNGDYKAERRAEQFRMQIIDPKVDSHAHIPAHAPRDYARKKLIEDFPSLHGKRSFLNLDAMEQRKMRVSCIVNYAMYIILQQCIYQV